MQGFPREPVYLVMTTNAASIALLASSLLVGCMAADESAAPTNQPGAPLPAPQGPEVKNPPSFTPETCDDVKAHDKEAKDGDYTLYIQGQASLPWPAYCHDMAATPREFLTLPQGAGKNTSMHKGSATSPGSDVVTVYQKVRIDPVALTIDIGDTTFAHSTGQLDHAGKQVTSMPFGVAMTCGGVASANIDVTGTPFHPEDTFPLVGTASTKGTWKLSTDRKGVDFSIDGTGTDCGFIGATFPKGTLPVNDTVALSVYLGYQP